MHYKDLLILLSYGPALGFFMIFFQAWLLFGATPASVVCCLCHSASIFFFILHWWPIEKKKKKNSNMFIFHSSTHDCLQNSERVKNVRPHTHKLSMILPRKFIHALGPVYFVVWHDEVATFLRSCYIKYSMHIYIYILNIVLHIICN